MRRHSVYILCLLLLTSFKALSQEASQKGDAKELSGMSVVGNKDAPKSLYIVPWKTSEIGVETEVASSLLNEDLVPVDKPVFMRELDFYRVSTEK